MRDMLVKLVPDDEPPADMALDVEPADEGTEPTAAAQPYDLAGAMAGLLVFLVGRGVLPEAHPMYMLGLAIVAVFVATFALEARRAKLPLIPMSVVAAELGLLYSLPASLVYFQAWQFTAQGLLALLLLVFLISITAFLGTITAFVFSHERRPALVIGVCFLGAFVLTNLVVMVRGR